MKSCRSVPIVAIFLAFAATALCAAEPQATKGGGGKKLFRAGAYAQDITPIHLPVIVNGGMTERTADKISDRIHARCLVLDDGQGQVAIAIVDSCMIPRDLLDEAKRIASGATGIPMSDAPIPNFMELAKNKNRDSSITSPISNSAADTIRQDSPHVGRNEPCPCGSGKKYKKCCMRG
jgi:hypothetical protein